MPAFVLTWMNWAKLVAQNKSANRPKKKLSHGQKLLSDQKLYQQSKAIFDDIIGIFYFKY